MGIKSKYHTIAGWPCHTQHTRTPAHRHTPLRPAAVDVTAPRTLSLVSVIKCFKFQMHSTLNAKKVKYLPTKPHPQAPSPSARDSFFFFATWRAGFEANSHALRLNYTSSPFFRTAFWFLLFFPLPCGSLFP